MHIFILILNKMNINIHISHIMYSMYIAISHVYTVAGFDYELLLLPSASVLERTVQLLMWI